MRTLQAQASKAQSETAAALALVGQFTSISTKLPRQYVAELIVVRLFSLFEAIVEDAACRMVCGARYCDGTAPILLRPNPTRGFDRARDAMRNFGRSAPRNELRWSRASHIASNLEKLFGRNEHFVATLLGHGGFISDLRKIRNHIAHGNDGKHKRFQEVVLGHYGAEVPGLTPGRMLLSSRFNPIFVEQLCRQTGAILRAALKG